MGDTNTDLLKNKNNAYIQTIEANGYKLLNKINRRFTTRIKTNRYNNETRTIIDHIISDIHDYNYTISINNTDISDHKQILMNINTKIPLAIKFINNKIEINKNIVDHNELTYLLNNTDFNNINNFEQLESTLRELKQTATKKIEYTKIVNPFKPWVNCHLIKLNKPIFKTKT